MEHSLRDIMTQAPITLDASDTVCEAARRMRAADVGDVLVQDDGALCGIVTDRDLVVRSLADERDPKTQCLRELCSSELATLEPGASIDDAVNLMRARGIRRLPVVEGGIAHGIVSLGDLARIRDPDSVLGRISSASATR